MNELKRGSLVMRCVADSDVEGYVKAGWKLVEKTKKSNTKIQESAQQLKKRMSTFEDLSVPINEDDSNSDTIEE